MNPQSICILGKELHGDPVRGLKELRARAAAASCWIRRGATRIYTLEARLRGQPISGSTLVLQLLQELQVDPSCIYQEDSTFSTRHEIERLRELCPPAPLILTAVYHIPRCRKLLTEAGFHAVIAPPEAFLRSTTPLERDWILSGIPDSNALAIENRRERLFTSLETMLSPLPYAWRCRLEQQAGQWLRGNT